MRTVCNCRPLTCYGRQHRLAYTIPGSSMLSCIWETGKLKTVFLGFHCSSGPTRDAVSTRQARLPRTWETKRTDYNVEATQLSCQTVTEAYGFSAELDRSSRGLAVGPLTLWQAAAAMALLLKQSFGVEHSSWLHCFCLCQIRAQSYGLSKNVTCKNSISIPLSI